MNLHALDPPRMADHTFTTFRKGHEPITPVAGGLRPCAVYLNSGAGNSLHKPHKRKLIHGREHVAMWISQDPTNMADKRRVGVLNICLPSDR